ncbi:MAG: NlpC/P60 family protein [Saprospiraceae bacterium]
MENNAIFGLKFAQRENMFAICPLSVVPLRSHPSEKSEMISQLLFGEVVEIIAILPHNTKLNKRWCQVRCTWDNYVGWVSAKQIHLLDEDHADTLKEVFPMSLEIMQPVMASNYSIPITLGASLPYFDGIQFKIGQTRFTFSGLAINPQQIIPSTEILVKIAKKYLFAPYLRGGRSPFGIDSAGLVQMCFKAMNIPLFRTAREQAEQGNLVDFVQTAQPGDLAFFDNTVGKIIHVGIILPDSMILHAFGNVKIDFLDHFGIFDLTEKKYTHKLRIVRRLLVDVPTSQFSIKVNAEKELTEVENELSLF